MARVYYIFRNGRLRRRQNTLYLEEPAQESDHEATNSMDERATASECNSAAVDDSRMPSGTDEETNTTQIGQQERKVMRRPIPIEDIEELYLFGELDMNTKLVCFLGQKGIPVHVFSYYGWYTGTFYPRETNVSGHLLVKQVEHYLWRDKRLPLAREFVAGALHNMHRNLLYYQRRGKDVAAQVEVIEREQQAIAHAARIDELRGIEGRARDAYYRTFNEIVTLADPFTKRVKRPPNNLMNALISFGNSLLYAATLAQIYVTQLNPTISYLHEPSERRFSLSLDIAEVFKPLIVDRVIFRVLNKGMIGEADVDESMGICLLNERARKKFVEQWEEQLRTTVRHRRLKRSVSYRRMIRLECYKLIRHLLGMEQYRALKAWW